MQPVGFKVSFFAIILLIMFLAFGAGLVSRLFSSRSNSGGGWFVLLGLALVGLLFFSYSTVRVEHRISPAPQVVASAPQFVHDEPHLFSAPVALTPPTPPAAQAAGESIEEMWKKLTAPRIDLEGAVDESSDAESVGPSSPQELTQAAKVILSASLPGADPFTQGWLVNAAKSILGMPISASEQAELHAVAVEAGAMELSAPESTPTAPAGAVVSDAPPQSGAPHDAELPKNIVISRSKVSLERPEWVVTPPKQIGNVRKFVVVSDPFVSLEECRRDADRKMQDLTLHRAAELSGASMSRRLEAAMLEDLGLGADYARRELCTDEFVDVIDSSVGEMKQTYALLEFNESQDALLVDRARAYSRREGLQDVTLIGGGLLASVATLFGLLKVDTWTRGYYTKRLFLGVPAAIITVLALLMS